jgi:Holliday junction resolvasome RuvABC endonuclease subunit
MKILGVDVGLNAFAMCSIDCRKKGRLKSKVKHSVFGLSDNRSKAVSANRLVEFLDRYINKIEGEIKRNKYVVIEKPFGVMGSGRVLLELYGICKYLCWKHKRKFVEVPQKSLKLFATGKGNALKSDMVLRLYKEHGIEGYSEDEVDAFWLAYLGYCILGKERKLEKFRKNVITKLVV